VLLKMHRKRLILTGIIGRYPVGGVTWCALHYLAGLQRLGYDVFYLEDTGECGFDPVANGLSTAPLYSTRYIRGHLAMVGLGNAWTYVDWRVRTELVVGHQPRGLPRRILRTRSVRSHGTQVPSGRITAYHSLRVLLSHSSRYRWLSPG